MKQSIKTVEFQYHSCPICSKRYVPAFVNQVYCSEECYSQSRLFRQRATYEFASLKRLDFRLTWPHPLYFQIQFPDHERFVIPDCFRIQQSEVSANNILEWKQPISIAIHDTLGDFEGYFWQATQAALVTKASDKHAFWATYFQALCCQDGQYYQCVDCHKRYANFPFAREWSEFKVGFRCCECFADRIPF